MKQDQINHVNTRTAQVAETIHSNRKNLVILFFVMLGVLLSLFVLQKLQMDRYLEEGYQHETKGKYEDAFQSYLKAAELGDVIAQNYLAAMYEAGRGVEQNKPKALQWHVKAAKNGHADSQNILGVMYEKGEGVNQSDQLAIHWYEMAAKQGFVLAQNNLAQMFKN